MKAMEWAEAEFGDADLGDIRRTNRLVSLSSRIITSPECSLSEMMGSESENKAAHRFFASEAYSYADMIRPSIDRTIGELNRQKRIYLIQDSSHLCYDSHPATKGLGHVGSTGDRNFQGIMMHWTLALNASAECLGVATMKLWERAPALKKNRLNGHQNKPIETKESYKWLDAVDTLDGHISQATEVVWIADREADIYDFIDRVVSKGHEFVIRCNVDRVIGDEEELLKDRIRSSLVIGHQTLHVPRNGKEIKIDVSIQCCDASLLVQRRKGGAKSSNLCSDQEINVVRVFSCNPEDDFEWILLTSFPIETLEECLEIIWIYKQRWHIELVHKTLKSGFQAEKMTLSSADRLEKALAVLLPCAVKVFEMSQKIKHEPQKPATTILSPIECSLLSIRNHKSPTYIPNINEAWYWIGLLGGFRGSKNSAPPGQMTFWRGYIHLRDMVLGAEMYRQSLENEKCVH